MRMHLLKILWILSNRRITATPFRVLRKLREKDIHRLPPEVHTGGDNNPVKTNAVSFIRKWLDGEFLSRHNGYWTLNSFLPPFPGKAFDRMFENLLSGRRLSPVSAFLACTAQCPYDCRHCSHKRRKTGHLSTRDWLSIIQDLQDLGSSIIGFTGGEPMLRSDLPELVEASVKGGSETIVFTSGAAVTDQKLAALKKAGLWSFCVSLDYPSPEPHNRMRGADNAYETAIEAIRLSKRYGFYTMIGSVATPEFVDKKLYQKLYLKARKLGVDEYRIVEPMPCGNLNQSPRDHFLTPEQIHDIRRFHVSTNGKGRLPKICAFNQIESPELFGCGAGTQHLYIDSAGEVCPCDFTPLSFGNALKEPLEEIWNKMTAAMGNPRRHCFIQANHKLLGDYNSVEHPLPYDISKEICAKAGNEGLPDYFAAMMNQTRD